MHELLWWLLAAAGVAGSGLSSGLETGIYSLNRVRLHVRAHRPRSRAAILAALVDRPVVLLTSLLIATNIATNIATSSLAVILHGRGLNPWQVMLVNVVVMTPLFFIFAETLPKDLFAAYADRLVYPFARLMRMLNFLFKWIGLLGLITGISGVMMKLMRAPLDVVPLQPRGRVGMLIRESVGHGLLSDDQYAMVQRVLTLGDLTVEDKMRSWEDVVTVRPDESGDRLWRLADQSSRSRYPVVDAAGQVQGIIDINEVLLFEARDCPSPAVLSRPALTLDAVAPLRLALTRVQHSGQPMAIVTRQNKPVGIVTLKDLIEPITGELNSW